MYLMFLASSHDGKVNLVEWRAMHPHGGVEEEFQKALDHYAQTRPHMGDWTMIHALTVKGSKIVPVLEIPPKHDVLNEYRNKRIIKAIQERFNKAD